MNEIYPRSHTFGVNPLLFVIFQHRISHSSISMLALSSLLPPPQPSFPLLVGKFDIWILIPVKDLSTAATISLFPWFSASFRSSYSSNHPIKSLRLNFAKMKPFSHQILLENQGMAWNIKVIPHSSLYYFRPLNILRHLRFNIFFRSYFFFAFLQDEPPW